MLHDEAARAAHHVQTHEIAPVIGNFALLECRQRSHATLVTTDEFVLATQFGQQLFRTNADVGIFIQEQGQLC